MRKIISPEKQKSKERFNQLIVGLVLIFLMMLSVLGYSLNSKDEEEISKKILYNGYEFNEVNGFWVLNAGQFKFIFNYNPEEVSKSYSNLSYIDTYYDKPLYFYSENSEATSEIYVNLNQFVQRFQPACLNDSNCTGNYPVKDCSSNFIIIKIDNSSSIEQNQSCVFIQGPEEEIVKLTDEFLFKIT